VTPITTVDALALALARNRGPATWGYCRVSSDKQEAGLSLDTQINDIRTKAASADLPEPIFVSEVASAAKPCFSVKMPGAREDTKPSMRPLFALLVSALTADRDGSTLIVWKLDRLSRVLYEQELVIDLLNRSEVTLLSTQPNEDDVLMQGGGDPSRTMMRQIMGAVAQYERALIRLRTEAGIRTKAAQGGWLGGRVPFGYRVDGGDLSVEPIAAEIVRRIFALRDLDLLSHNAIAANLNAATNSREWHRIRVSRVLANRSLYAGVYEDPFGTSHQRPDLRILLPSWDAHGVPIS
jgi:DNA invertase Pin-like site-specific DNA recombinase